MLSAERQGVVEIVDCLLVAAFATVVLLLSGLDLPRDALVNWSAVQLLLSGENPYDPSLLREVANQAHVVDGFAAKTFAPPWVMVFLAAVFLLPFSLAWPFSLFLTVGGTLLASHFFLKLYTGRSANIPILLFANLIFLPLWELVFWGHYDIFVLLGMVGVVCALRARADKVAGIFFLAAALKPHVSAVYLAYVAIEVIRRKRWVVFYSAVAAWAGVLSVAFYLNPMVFRQWWEVVSSEAEGASSMHSAVLSSQLRYMLGAFSSSLGRFLMLLFPCLGLFVVSCLSRGSNENDFYRALPLVMVLTVVTAPYAWLHDFVVFVPVHVFAVIALFDLVKRVRPVGLVDLLLVGCVLFSVYLNVFGTPGSARYWWMPFIYLYLAYQMMRTNIVAAMEVGNIAGK